MPARRGVPIHQDTDRNDTSRLGKSVKNDYHPSEEFDYDVCLSFAGEQRAYVRELAEELKKHNIRVFFDEFEEAVLWVNRSNFIEAFETAEMLVHRQIFPGQLPEGWAPPDHGPLNWMW